MNYNYDLSIIIPGIRNQNWTDLYFSASRGVKNYSTEFIFSGPHPLPPELQNAHNVKYLKTYGSPTRALHMASLVAEGRFFTWLSDDAWVYENSIDACMVLILAANPEKDAVCVRYTEGQNHSGAEFPINYWSVAYHSDLHVPGVDRSFLAGGVLLVAQSLYKHLGGLDHRFEHINMNVHDFCFRMQRDGGKLLMSPSQVMNCDWDPHRNAQNSNVIAAFFENDRPLFHKIYDGTQERPIQIDLENWRESPVIWPRRDYNIS